MSNRMYILSLVIAGIIAIIPWVFELFAPLNIFVGAAMYPLATLIVFVSAGFRLRTIDKEKK